MPARPRHPRTRVRPASLRAALAAAAFALAGCSTAEPTAIPPPGPLVPTDARVVGVSRLGVPITLRRAGARGPRVVLIGLIHGDEAEGYARFDDLWARLSAAPPMGVRLEALPTINPDGHAARTRGNAAGVDLNRNWPASNFAPSATRGPHPLSEPESRAAHRTLTPAPDLIIVFHSTGSGPFVNFDGPPRTAAIAAAFADAARRGDPRWRLVPNYTNPPGSLGTYAGRDRGIPTLTIEFARGHDEDAAFEAAAAGIAGAILALAGLEGGAR